LSLLLVISLAIPESKEPGSILTGGSCFLDQNSFSCSREERCSLMRSELKYNLQPDLICGEPFQRVTFEEMLQIPKFANYSSPFVMTGAIQGYESLKDLDWLAEKFGWNVADFYPFNELNKEDHPIYLFRFNAGVEQVKKMPGEGVFGEKELNSPAAKPHPAKYLQMTFQERDWIKLPIQLHDWFVNDFYTRCLTEDRMDEFFWKTHWKMILIGQPGAGMFWHKDATRSSSWHLHVTGRKWWRLCWEDRCFEEILGEGDVLFYPSNWFHETQCLDMPTTTLASQILTEHNKVRVIDELWLECTSAKHRFKYSGKLCDALEGCWEEVGQPVRPWRDSTPLNLVHERDSPDATKTWYDLYKIYGDIPPEE